MHGSNVIRGSIWTKTKSLLCHTRLPLAKSPDGLRLCSSYSKLVTCNHGNEVTSLSSHRLNNHFVLNKRHFSVTNSSCKWVPWNWLFPEPSAIPKGLPSDPIDAAAALKSAVPDAQAASTIESTALADPSVVDVVGGAIVDPPFIELGLATGWYPKHFVHQLLEFVHLNSGLEWWSTIVIGTMLIRIVTLPLFIYTRKIAVRSQTHSAEMKEYVEKVEKVKHHDNFMRLYLARKELKDFMKRTGTEPWKFVVMPSMSIIFITCVMALRDMVAVPVPSLIEGGIFWFSNLAIADPSYALPVITGGLMGFYLHQSLKDGAVPARYAGLLRKAKYLPLGLVPLILGNTPSAVFLYWLSTTTFSLGFLRILQIPGMKEKLGIPLPTPILRKDGTPEPSKGLVQTFKDWRQGSYEATYKKMRHKEIRRERKSFAKDQKKILKGEPPVTFTIGVDALPTREEVPDFEREWRRVRPKHMGQF